MCTLCACMSVYLVYHVFLMPVETRGGCWNSHNWSCSSCEPLQVTGDEFRSCVEAASALHSTHSRLSGPTYLLLNKKSLCDLGTKKTNL